MLLDIDIVTIVYFTHLKAHANVIAIHLSEIDAVIELASHSFLIHFRIVCQ